MYIVSKRSTTATTKNMAEVRVCHIKCCCIDNFKASKIINIVSLVIEGIAFISGLFLLLFPTVRIKKLFLFLKYFHSFLQTLGIGAILASVNAVYMIVDALLLAGSIKRNKVPLIVGLVLSAIVILALVVLPIVFADETPFIGTVFLILTLSTIWFRLWSFLIGVGTLQAVMLLEK